MNPLKWKSTNFSIKHNLFEDYLPPILKASKENLEKLGDKVSRPTVQVTGVRIFINIINNNINIICIEIFY